MLPVIQVGPLALQAPALLLMVSIWLALSVVERYAKLFGHRAENLSNLVWVALIGLLVGARLAYVVRYFAAFEGNWLSVLSPSPMLFDWESGAVIGVLAGLIYGQRKGFKLMNTLDALTAGLAVWMVALPLANFLAGTANGMASDVPWAVNLNGANRHPVQIYEAGLAALILWWVFPLRIASRGWADIPGRTFLTWLAASAGARLLLEPLRAESNLLPGNLRMAQVIAWLLLAAALWLLWKTSGRTIRETGDGSGR